MTCNVDFHAVLEKLDELECRIDCIEQELFEYSEKHDAVQHIVNVLRAVRDELENLGE